MRVINPATMIGMLDINAALAVFFILAVFTPRNSHGGTNFQGFR